MIAALSLYLFWPSSTPEHFVSFGIETGESFRSVAQRLQDLSLVESESFFYYLARLTGKSAELKAGEYELNNTMSDWEILKIVTGASVKLHRVTIPEGFNMFQVADRLQRKGLVDKIQFLEAAWDPVFVSELGIPSFTVEGYLFPETYLIARGTPPRKIIRMMVDMFWSQVPESFIERAKKMPTSFHEAVIMASVIEKETGYAAEMGMISSVFYNRIRRGMRLQSDPTAIYDLMPYGGKPTSRHLLRTTAFNTYRIPKLPLTPIANPGILAIQASLWPQDTDYIFFVSRRDGSHEFTETYAEHKKAIDRFLRNR